MFAKGDNFSATKRASNGQDAKKQMQFKSTKQTYGLDIAQLRNWSQDRLQAQLDTEMAKQEIAVTKVRQFLDAIVTVVKLQSWWRMIRIRRQFFAVMNERRLLKKRCYRGWKIFWKSERLFYVCYYCILLVDIGLIMTFFDILYSIIIWANFS